MVQRFWSNKDGKTPSRKKGSITMSMLRGGRSIFCIILLFLLLMTMSANIMVEEDLYSSLLFSTHNMFSRLDPYTVFYANETCDYSQGKWVKTQRPLLYSGYSCKRWLSPMWACRMNSQRSSFAYERLRWQPSNCSLPPFNNRTFLQRMKNKTVAFIGDSLGRQQFQSLMCLLTQGRDEMDNVIDVGTEYGFPVYTKRYDKTSNSSRSSRPSSWAYRFRETNTTILFSWSTTLCYTETLQNYPQSPADNNTLLDQSDSSEQESLANAEVAIHFDKPATFLASNVHKLDVIILNTGAHWSPHKFNKNKWKAHMDGKPLNLDINNVHVIKSYCHYSVNAVTSWLSKQIEMGITNAKVFYRTSSPNHFSHGDWNTGGHCNNTKYQYKGYMEKQNQQSLPDNVVVGSKVKLLNITWLSQLRDDAHISRYSLKSKDGFQDCLHWCMPGVPDTWNEILFAELLYLTRDSNLK